MRPRLELWLSATPVSSLRWLYPVSMEKQDERRRRVISAQVPDELAHRLERLAAEADRSLSGEVRRALAEHVAQADEVDRLHSIYDPEGKQ